MHTICTTRACNVRSIVYEQTRFTATHDLNSTRDKFKKHTRVQGFLTYLKERDLRCNGSFNQAKDTPELRIVSGRLGGRLRRRLGGRRAARYWIDYRKLAVHLWLTRSESAKP